MKTIYLILALFVFGSITSCKLCKKDKEVKPVETTVTAKKLTIDKSGAEPASADFSLESISISGNILTINVSFSGGCEEHEFELYFDGNYKKSMPPKAAFFLQHLPHHDQCRSIVNKELKFDISEAKYPGQNEIMVQVRGLINEVSYKY